MWKQDAPRRGSVCLLRTKRTDEADGVGRVVVHPNTCFLGELGHSGQHRRVSGLKEVDHEQGQGVVIEKGATSWVNNQKFQLDKRCL